MDASTCGQQQPSAEKLDCSETQSETDSNSYEPEFECNRDYSGLSSDDTETESTNSNYSESQSSNENSDADEPVTEITDEFMGPLYEGAAISVCATYCTIMEFAISCRLPYSSIEKLLQLLRLLCPRDSKLPTSIYKLKCFFKVFSSAYQMKEFCSGCGQRLPGAHICTCRPGQKNSVVVTFPSKKAIQSLMQSTSVLQAYHN